MVMRLIYITLPALIISGILFLAFNHINSVLVPVLTGLVVR